MRFWENTSTSGLNLGLSLLVGVLIKVMTVMVQ